MRRREHNTAVVICLCILPGSLFSKTNLIICCGLTLETSNCLQAKYKTAVTPRPPLPKKPSIRFEKQTAQMAG